MMTPESLVEQLAADLSELATGALKTDRAARRIREAAEDRRAAVDGDVAKARENAITDDDAAQAYQDAVLERGTLDRVSAAA